MRLDATRHQIIAGPFGRGARQNRGLNFYEAVLIQERAQGLQNACAHLQVGEHLRTAQIDIAIAQAYFIADIKVVYLKRWRVCGIQNQQRLAEQFHRATFQLWVFAVGRASAQSPFCL